MGKVLSELREGYESRIEGVRDGSIEQLDLPDIKSTQAPVPYFSLLFIIFKASSNNVSPVCLSSMTSINLSASASLLREGSRTIAIRLRSASSIRIHPRRA